MTDEILIEVQEMRVKLAREIRVIARGFNNHDFSIYIDKIVEVPNSNANIAKAARIFALNCLNSEIELLEDLYAVYTDLVYKV
jgi:hypothetical protein